VETILGGIGNTSLNSDVFCDVIAVTTEQPKMPNAENVLRSDCIPAPPPASLPATVNTTFNAREYCAGAHIISR
jgi:hypothetical protein